MTRFASALLALLFLAPRPALAAELLFVSNEGADTNIVTALRADGHTVTVGADESALAGDLSAYEAVFWSATWCSAPASTFTNLTAYVMGGGRVFVTGYDSLLSSAELVTFCGGTGRVDLVGSAEPGPILMEANSLTTGVVDIRGVTPTGGHTDRDGLTGLTADTTEVSRSASGGSAQWTLRALGDGEIAFVSNGTSSGAHASWESTAAGGAGAYNAAIRNFAFAADFAMSEPGAPEITFDAPFTADEGEAITIGVSFVDAEGDSYTYSWDLDDDGSFGERPGVATYAVAAGTTDGAASLRIGVEVVDAHGNTASRYRNLRIANVAPRITSDPPLFTSVGAGYRYPLVVEEPAGELDPLTFSVVRGPATMAVSPAGVVQWTPTVSDVTLPGETVRVEVQVDDGDGGTATQSWELRVSPNRAPTPPTPAYPIERIAILDTTPRLAAGNSEDLDLDPITYLFEIDTVDTFDSPALRTSAALPETPGFTAWQIEEPLAENRLYHWRVRANDGDVDSELRQSAFYVVRDPSLGPPDAGTPDRDAAVIGGDAGLIPGLDAGLGGGGGGCSAGRGSPSSRPGLLVVALAGLALSCRRRARR